MSFLSSAYYRYRVAPGNRKGWGHLLAVFGATILFIQVSLGFLGLPMPLYRWLNGKHLPPVDHPGYVVVLGGSGVPSPSALMRTYYGGRYAAENTNSVCIIALPAQTDDERGNRDRMREELMLRGVPAQRIRFEPEGRNTRQQALNVRRLLGAGGRDVPILLVTDPFHIRRAYLCFRKAGFAQVGVLPAHSVSTELDFRHAVLDPCVKAGMGWPGAGAMRYRFWINLDAQVWVTRELCALAWYALRGWI